MSLASGTRLGSYEIVSKLGDGGMGEVYRGTDTRLGREVAIKVLAAATASSPDALARFEREGRAIAALNHPNICTLHDVGTDDGRPYLVMELLAGATLHQVLASGPLSVGALIDHAIALADALQAAHTRGIIHRDLKPGNVFLTEHGVVKILDFGLAKADSDRHDEARTIEAALTGPGTTLGTLSYMSPEQLRGEAVDARSDLFSLGLVLYEMATACRAFTGKTSVEVSAAILHAQPPSPASLRADLPDKLDDILLKALEKDRDLRYQTAAELRGDLKRLKRGDHREGAPVSSAPAVAATPPASSSDAALAVGLARRHAIAVAGVVLVAVAAAAAAWWTRGRTAPESSLLAEVSLQPLTFHGQAGDAGISGDGRFIAYVRQNGTLSSVVVKQLSSDSDVVILPPRTGVSYYAPAVTPDGGYVDVLEVEPGPKTRVVRVPFLGGAPRPLLGNGVRSGIGWSPDGQRIAFIRSDMQTQNSLVVADAQGQNPKVLVTRQAPSFFLSVTFGRRGFRPSWSPDGRWIAVIGINTADPGNAQLVEIEASSGSERVVRHFEGASEVAYLDDDRWVASTFSAGTDQALQWRLFPREGPALALTRDLSYLRGVHLTTARSAGIATRTTVRSSITVTSIADGNVAQVVEESSAEPAAAALDGAGNVFYTAKVSEGLATFRHAGAGAAGTMVATNLLGALPSPDGTFIIGIRPNVGLVRANADGSEVRVLLEDVTAVPIAITRDNAMLVYQSNREGHQQPWKLTLARGAAERLANLYINSGQLWLSADEREVILSTTGETRICAFPSLEACRAVKVIAGPFSADGKTVLAIAREGRANIVAQPLDGSAPIPLTRFTDKEIFDFSLSPDRSRIAITRFTRVSDVVMVKGLK